MSEPTKRGAGRGVKIALAISLAANLAVIGLVAGIFFGGEQHGGPPRLNTFGLGPFAFAFEREDRRALRDALGASDVREERRQLGGALRDVQAALLAEPFDREAAEAALERSRGLVVRLQMAGHTALLNHLEQMTQAERAQLAENLERIMRRGPGGRDGR